LLRFIRQTQALTPMIESFTAAAQRAIDRSEARARQRGARSVEPTDLLAALVDESESRAAQLLSEFGLLPGQVWKALGAPQPPLGEEELASFLVDAPPHSPALRATLSDAGLHARAFDRGRLIGTEQLLASLLSASGEAADVLTTAGLRISGLVEKLSEPTAVETSPLPLPPGMPPLALGEPALAIDLGRILDASANRAREGLRVVEDYVRFVLDDPFLTRRLKDVRHRLAELLNALDSDLLLGSRDTRGD